MGNIYVVPRNSVGKVPVMFSRRDGCPFSYALRHQHTRLYNMVMRKHTVDAGSEREIGIPSDGLSDVGVCSVRVMIFLERFQLLNVDFVWNIRL